MKKIKLIELKQIIRKIIKESIGEENREYFETIKNMLEMDFSISSQQQALSLAESLGFSDEIRKYIEEKFDEAKEFYENKKHLFTDDMLKTLVQAEYFDSNLQKLNLSACESLTDISSLTSLENLTVLNLSGCKSLTDISPLTSLENLTVLNLSWCNKIENFDPLIRLQRLAKLYLVGSKISDRQFFQLENSLKRTEIIRYIYQ